MKKFNSIRTVIKKRYFGWHFASTPIYVYLLETQPIDVNGCNFLYYVFIVRHWY